MVNIFFRYIGGLSAGQISHSLGRTIYIAIYRMHSEGSDQTTDISVYPNTNTSGFIAEKKKKGSVKVAKTIYIYKPF